MGEVVTGSWADPEDLGVFTPNCPNDLVLMEPKDAGWTCPVCGLVSVT